jgi:hypothetical protein
VPGAGEGSAGVFRCHQHQRQDAEGGEDLGSLGRWDDGRGSTDTTDTQ